MTERLYIGTHKGLFELARHNGVWDIADLQFLGDPVSAVLAVSDGIVYAALDLGHFGAKLWRRNRTGNWRELPVPVIAMHFRSALHRVGCSFSRDGTGLVAGWVELLAEEPAAGR